MATRKVYDLAVKVGSYTDRNGNPKGRYVNCGAIYQKDDGSEFISINRTFNPAGVPNPENKESILVSRFEVKDRTAPNTQAPAAEQPKPAAKPAANGFDDMDDEIPF